MSFKDYLAGLKFSKNTIARYTSWEAEIKGYLSDVESERWSYNDLLSYIDYKSQMALKRSTMVLILGRIKHYYKYLKEENPLEDFKLKGREKRSKGNLLTSQQLKQIAMAYNENKRLSLLNKIGVNILIYQGLSSHELSLLKLKHIDIKRGEISVPSNRLNERVLALEGSQLLDIITYTKGKEKERSLLEYQGARHLQNRHTHWKEQIKREIKKQQLKIPFKNLQQLRNSRISQWVKDLGILHAQYLAGHHRLGATQTYQRENYEQLRSSFNQLHPLY